MVARSSDAALAGENVRWIFGLEGGMWGAVVEPGGKNGRLCKSGGDDIGLEHGCGWLLKLLQAFALAERMVCVMDGIRGTVTSRANALYLNIWDVALKSP